MKNKNYETLGDIANFLNDMAISHRLISASTASAFTYMIREDLSIEKLRTLIFLILKIKEENEHIASTFFYETILKLEETDIELSLELMKQAIAKPIDLESSGLIVIPKAKNFVQIGRSEKPEHGNDIVFKTDKTLSRIHLVVTVENDEFYIEDRSANGTFVNGTKIEKGVKVLVKLSDKIRIGREETLVKLNHPKISKLIC